MKLYSGTQTDYNAGVISDNRSWAVSLLYLRNSVWNDVGEGTVVSFNLSDYVNDGSNITMGSVAGAKLTVTLKELSADTVSKLVYGTRMKIKLTLSNANAVLDSVTLVLDDKKFKQGRSGNYSGTVTLYDLSYLMAHIYSSTKETPTCYQVIQDISDKYGLGINASVAAAIIAIDGSLSARTYIPLADYTCKQTLGYMAGCYGCYAKINEDDEICFEWFSSSGDTIAHDRIFEGGERISEMESRVIAMIESGTQNAIVTAPDNASGYSINFENPYISQEQATAIYNAKIAGGAISFRVGKIKYKGSPLNNPGTIVTVEDLNGETTSFYIMKRTLRFDGGLSETIECQGESDTTISYKSTSPTQQKINRALSRMEEAIKAATSAIKQTEGSVFELMENETEEGKNTGFKLYYQGSGDSAFDDCVIMGTAGGIGFSTDGGKTFDAAAMYFYQDEAGEIHGCINGEVLKAGSVAADKINTDGLTVGTGNVTGLDEKLSELDDYIFDLEYGTSAISETQQEIIDICLTEDMTQINGAHLATGSVLAASIAANAITADKLSVGIADRENLLYNSDFSKTWTDDNGTKHASGWSAANGTIGAQTGWITFHPSSATINSGFYQKVWLKPGKYSIVARMQFYNVSSVTSNAKIGYILAANYSDEAKYDDVSQNIGSSSLLNGTNKEINVKYVVNYKGEEGFVDVGLWFTGFEFSGYLSVAWVGLFQADEEVLANNFFCSDSNWLKTDYKTSNLLTYQSALSGMVKQVNPFAVNSDGELDVISGNIGCLNFSRLQLNIESHVSQNIYNSVSDSYIDLTFDGYLEISKPTGAAAFECIGLSSSDIVGWSKALAPSIHIYDKNNYGAFMGVKGFYCSGEASDSSTTYSSLTPYSLYVAKVQVTSTEKAKSSISEAKSSVLDKFKSSKIYSYKLNSDPEDSKGKMGFIIERETPVEVISDKGDSIDLYSMASMNWKATQEIIERLENLERAVKQNA